MKHNYTIVFLILLCLLGGGVVSMAQAPTYPFPQNRTFGHGFMPTTVTQAHVQTGYDEFITRYYRECAGDNSARIIEPDRGNRTVSEGIGYGMLLTAYAGDKARFDRLWRFYKNRRNGRGLMNWLYSDCTSMGGANGATDGDLDAAMALVIAACQWPAATAPFNYTADATALITAIRDHEFTTCGGLTVQKPGDAFGGCTCTNPSYFSPGYYRAFAQFLPGQAAFWTKAANDTYTTLNGNAHANTGLVSAWCTSTGSLNVSNCGVAEGGGGGADTYQYDAARTPWRIAVDYMWWGTPQAETWLKKLTTWVKAPASNQGGWTGGGGIANIRDGYNRDGTIRSQWRNSAFVGAFCLASMANNQTDANSFHQWWMQNSVTTGNPGAGQLDDRPYYQHSLKVLYMFLSSGNFWYPCSTGPVCDSPNLGPDVSLCGVASITLNSGISTGTGIRFTWRRNGTIVVNNSTTANTHNVTQTGTYEVTVDNNGCIRSDEVVVTGTLPEPSLGGPYNLCSPSSITLNSGVAGSGLTYEWRRNGTVISGATGASLPNVRTAGTYRVTVSATGCTSRFSETTVTSQVAVPNDNCRSTAGTVNLSVTGGGQYNWYAAPTGGTPLAGGTNTLTFTTPSISTTTTYYVQDMSSTSGSVGPANNLGSGVNWGINADNRLLFTANSNINITQLKVPFTVYGASPGTLTVQILDASNTVRATVTSQEMTPAGTGNQFLTFNFSPGIQVNASTWGANLKMRISGRTISGDPLWSDVTTAAYPYNSTPSGIMTITGKEGGGGNNAYMYFHDIRFTTGVPCDRVPVVASIGAGCASCTLPENAGAITGNTTVCSGQTGVSYSIPAVTGATSYNWTLPTGATIASGSGTRTIIVNFGSTGGNITVTPVNDCGNGEPGSRAITVNTVPAQPGTMTGNGTVCSGATGVAYSVPAVAGATSYTWTLPTGATIASGNNTNSITVNFGTSGGDISVRAVNACGESAARTRAITVNPVPAQPGNITGNGTVCSGATGVAYSVPTVAGATGYTWTLPAGATIASGNNSNSITVNFGTSGGDISVRAVNACGESIARTRSITVNPIPVQPGVIAGNGTVCSGAVGVVYSIATVNGATGYNWTVPAGATITSGQNTTSITVTFGSSGGNVSVRAVNDCG
ncbi:MAG: glycosyl hydrolase family 8, partial [Cytophagaceae bacterium]